MKRNMFAYYHADDPFSRSGAKLASLFSLDQAESQGNESFQFTAPKQPKRNTSTSTAGPPPQKPATPPPSAPAVLFATAVHAFRFVNGQYVKQGKVGAAVLGNHGNKEYKILIYGSQQKPITTARIHPGFVLTVQPGNYATFYDDQRQNWSLMFDSVKVSSDFCKEVCLAKRNSDPSQDKLVVQDLVLGEGQAVDTGDTLQIVFTGWLLHNYTIGETFKSNSTTGQDQFHRVKLGPGKEPKGWEGGLLGMQRGGRRLLVIPPSKTAGPKGILNDVPPSNTLVLDVEIQQVRFSVEGASECLDQESLDSSPSASVASSSSEAAQPEHRDQQTKSNSPNEKLKSKDSAKAKLISRMAKMGQPMLPFLRGAIPAQPDASDSDTEDMCDSGRRHHSTPPTTPGSPSLPSSTSASETPPPEPVSAPSQQVVARQPETMAQPVEPISMQTFMPYPTVLTSSHIQPIGFHTVAYQAPDVSSLLMSDVRQFSTEMRLDVGKVADKLEQLSAKVDKLQNQEISFGGPSVSMETTMIMHSIQRIIQENSVLKKELYEKSTRIDEQNRKIGELMEQNQRYVHKSSLMLEQNSNSLQLSGQLTQTRLLMAEQDKVRLVEELSASSALVCQLQQETSSLQQRAAELQAKLNASLQSTKHQTTQISSLEEAVEELKASREQTHTQWRGEKQKCRELQLQVNNMEEELEDLKTDKQTLDQVLSDRKRKWQAERGRLLAELEETRQNSQQESDQLRAQLRRTRSAPQNCSTEQVQAELEVAWQRRCDASLASAREVHQRALSELMEQRDMMEETVSQLHDQISEVQRRARSEKKNLEIRLAELEQKLFEQTNEEATATQLKQVMNRVFHSLKEEFDLQQTYTGSTILKLAFKTIKSVTLHFLADLNDIPAEADDEREEGDEEEEEEGEACPGESLQDRKTDGQVVRPEKAKKADVGEINSANTNVQAEKSN
ncbi:FK506-binding protein 15 isoform X1 [Alosa sapidissima]|uniref:FK506-binding protein 15 isoform X1 n=1 Tax=Alosa sapidissima TaxID=34773 RepID=UPI001C08BD23|nr:FK506-binding protein 15 isoform X1 [Alosa sapidissima]